MATTDGTKVNLSLRGGGVRLSAYVGALAAFRDMGVGFGALAGASPGSIVGALVAAGGPEDRIYARWTSRSRARASLTYPMTSSSPPWT
jgi:NTE family protein